MGKSALISCWWLILNRSGDSFQESWAEGELGGGYIGQVCGDRGCLVVGLLTLLDLHDKRHLTILLFLLMYDCLLQCILLLLESERPKFEGCLFHFG
jgi:hypothetical protein